MHIDNAWNEVKECFRGFAVIHYLPATTNELLSPLNFALFRQQQSHYSFMPNTTEDEVRTAADKSGEAVTLKNVRAAVREIGYGMSRSAK